MSKLPYDYDPSRNMAANAVNRRVAYMKLWDTTLDALAKRWRTNASWVVLRKEMQRWKFQGFRIP